MDIQQMNQNDQIKSVVETFIQKFWKENQELYRRKIVHEINDHQLAKLSTIEIPAKGRSVETVMNEMIEDIYKYRYYANHPRYLGFVPGPASLLSWLGDIMTSAYNLHAGSWINCPAASCIEQKLIHWFCNLAGYGEESGGTFVSGGSIANMTALIAARDKILSEDQLSLGVAYVSDQTHSSVTKGLRMIGIPNSRIRQIPTDYSFRMDPSQLELAIQSDYSNGLIPFVVIASAGTTNTGSIDPLEAISAICQTYHLWMHVDGAYGASILLTKQYKHLLKGIEYSDSISWDAHKWLFQTYGCSMILIKNKKNLLNSFSTHPEYLNDLEIENDSMNTWDMGIELTRPARGLKLWLTMQVLGCDVLSTAIEHGFQLAQWAEEELKKEKDVEIISPAQLAIVTFRYAPCNITEKQKDQLNQNISKKMLENGYAGIFTTELNGKKVLRICSIHPDTTKSDIIHIVSLLNHYCKDLCEEI